MPRPPQLAGKRRPAGSRRLYADLVRIDGEDWWVLGNVPGWESHEIAVQAAILDGVPRATNLRLTLREDADNSGITASRLRGLPMIEAARLAVAADLRDVRRELSSMSRTPAAKHDVRAVTSVEDYARAYNLARERGLPPREFAANACGVSLRTADRYGKRAEGLGLIERRGRDER